MTDIKEMSSSINSGGKLWLGYISNLKKVCYDYDTLRNIQRHDEFKEYGQVV